MSKFFDGRLLSQATWTTQNLTMRLDGMRAWGVLSRWHMSNGMGSRWNMMKREAAESRAHAQWSRLSTKTEIDNKHKQTKMKQKLQQKNKKQAKKNKLQKMSAGFTLNLF